MRIHRLLIVFLIVLPVAILAQTDKVIKVKYLSTEYVYIDAGKNAGIAVGDQYEVLREGKTIAEVEVVYVADHSASCKVLNNTVQLQAGDRLKLKVKTSTEQEAGNSEKETAHKSEEQKAVDFKQEKKVKSLTRIRGNIGIEWYHFEDLTSSNLNFDQPSLRLYLKAKKLWNRDYSVRIKFRSRKYDRSRRYANGTPASEWRNRIYEASFSYDNPDQPINFKIGRIISNMFSGIGYIDGILLQNNLNKLWRWGVFAGSRPEWQYTDFQTSIQKYGGYINFLKGGYLTSRWESTLAFSGEYHGKTVSREFVYLRNSYNYKSRLSIYQSLELDYNRGWRKKKTNETISLTGLYISGAYDVFDWLNTGLSYDNRKNYYIYELRTLADSLFDSAFRHGVRANVSIRYFKNMRIYGNFGWRKRESEGSNTYSYMAGVNFSNLWMTRMQLFARFAGFSNYYTNGFNPSLSLNRSFRGGHYAGISAGTYIYTLDRNSGNSMNNWMRFSGQFELPWNMYLSVQYEYDWGDDVKGHRILAELGYRF
ncbi:MAG: hypothetical protein P8X42_03095 [Calditrichaceae bacterium]